MVPSFPNIDLRGIHPRSVEMIEQIDAQARTMARRRLADGSSPAELRAYADGLAPHFQWLADMNRQEADLLDLDARLWALGSLDAYDRATGRPRAFWLNLYGELVRDAVRNAASLQHARAA